MCFGETSSSVLVQDILEEMGKKIKSLQKVDYPTLDPRGALSYIRYHPKYLSPGVNLFVLPTLDQIEANANNLDPDMCARLYTNTQWFNLEFFLLLLLSPQLKKSYPPWLLAGCTGFATNQYYLFRPRLN